MGCRQALDPEQTLEGNFSRNSEAPSLAKNRHSGSLSCQASLPRSPLPRDAPTSQLQLAWGTAGTRRWRPSGLACGADRGDGWARTAGAASAPVPEAQSLEGQRGARPPRHPSRWRSQGRRGNGLSGLEVWGF